MLFNMSPLMALIPLIIYIILAFKNVNPLLDVFICVILSAIFTNHSLLNMGSVLAKSLGSFLSLIGFIILLGAALGEVLKKTGVAENIVFTLMKKIGINTEKKAMIASMITSIVLVTLLGTLAGANAIIAPIIISLVAAIGITPSTLSIIFQGAGQTGLFLGPFSPPVVTILGLTHISYVQYLLKTGLPISLICWVITYIMAVKVQKKTKGIYAYENIKNIDINKYKATKETKRATLAFIISLVLLIIYGIYSKGGASYAVVVMITVSIVTAIAGGIKLNTMFDIMSKGAGRMLSLFFMFVLFDPFVSFIDEAGAFKALAQLLTPLIKTGNKLLFSLTSTLTGVFGISGAAVAQSVVLNKMFAQSASQIGIPATMWSLILLVGSQMTSFAYPGADMICEMGLAESKDIKSMIKLGITIVISCILFILLRALFL